MDCTFTTDLGKFNYRVAAVILHDGKLLCQQGAADSNYFLPGGRVMFGESAENAILREISEELGAEANILRQLWLHENFFTEETTLERFHEICLYYLLEVPGLPEGRFGGDGGYFEWIPLERLPHTHICPEFLRAETGNLPNELTALCTLEPEYRLLTGADLTPDLFREFSRRQEVTRVWRKIDGAWVIVPNVFTEDWGQREFEIACWCLKNTVNTGGFVCGAFAGGLLKGICSVESTPLGSRGQYREMTCLHVSDGFRGHGMGRKLFGIAKRFAKELGGEKLYISSHSSVESQAFYKAMGCREAEEYSPEHVAREPLDCQIECDV